MNHVPNHKRAETTKLLEKNKGTNPHGSGLGNGFLGMTSKHKQSN